MLLAAPRRTATGGLSGSTAPRTLRRNAPRVLSGRRVGRPTYDWNSREYSRSCAPCSRSMTGAV